MQFMGLRDVERGLVGRGGPPGYDDEHCQQHGPTKHGNSLFSTFLGGG